MPTRMTLILALTFLPSLSVAGPVSVEEGWRQKRVMEQLKKSIDAETTAVGKFAVITRVVADEPDVNLRYRILEIASGIPGPELEALLTTLLKTDEDAGLRSQAATTLGRTGSEKSLAVLAKVAATDRTTSRQIGDIRGSSSARRAATFALAEFASRFPELNDKAAAELRVLPVVADAKDNEHLADARVQALYQITHDAALLKPFHERLRSNDAKDRERGVVAFRFLKLKEAPAEIVAALKDGDASVRSWTALVLGEIADPKTGPVLMAVAGDTNENAGPRCNAIGAIGQMKFAAAADLMERLLTDAEPAVPGNAAVALYRITGKKVKQFPEGYRAD